MIAFQPISAQPDRLFITNNPVLEAGHASLRVSDTDTPEYSSSPTRVFSRSIKFLADVAIALVLLVILAPVLVTIAGLVRRDGGHALYGHRRLGKDGRYFVCLKFRSMVMNSDVALKELLLRDPSALKEWQETHKLRNDPRVTRIGRFLRRTSLDELPQLLNVLRGEMSLVGPRPIIDAEIERYGHNISVYCGIRPGITGLWQVSGRSNITYDDRVRLDVLYARTWSLLQDVRILLRTVIVVLSRDGAV